MAFVVKHRDQCSKFGDNELVWALAETYFILQPIQLTTCTSKSAHILTCWFNICTNTFEDMIECNMQF